jgi:hypothetical protein
MASKALALKSKSLTRIHLIGLIWCLFFKLRKPTDTYQGSICLFCPEHPGKITVYYTKLREVVETEKITSVEYEQNSRDKDHGGEGKTLTKPYTLKPKAGWKIVPGSAKFHVMSSKDHEDGPKGLKNKWENQLENSRPGHLPCDKRITISRPAIAEKSGSNF